MTPALIATLGLVWAIEYLATAKSSRWARPELSLFAAFGVRLVLSTLLFVALWTLGWVDLSLFRWGNWAVPVQGMEWLGIPSTDLWSNAIPSLVVAITGVTALAIALPHRKSLGLRRLSLPTLLSVIILAALNAWTEELCFRVIPIAFLGVPSHFAIWASALSFGLPHYFGYPSRWPGVALATFLGWFLAQMTVQTGSIVGAFLVHWMQDVVILLLLSNLQSPSRFRTLSERPVQALAQAFALGMIWIGAFQMMLALGAPWGATAWGGQHTGALPLPLRMASALVIGIYVGFAVLYLARSGVINIPVSEAQIRKWSWRVSLFLGLGVVLNFMSPSMAERSIMGPVSLLLALAAWMIARRM